MAESEAKRLPWSVSRYATLYVMLVLLIFIALSSFVYIKLQPILDESAKNQNQLAREELSGALSLAILAAQRSTSAISNWDEARQQIGQPAYYTYWHDYRVKDSGMIDGSVIHVDLYSASGANLDASNTSPGMPARVSPEHLGLTFVQESGRIFIYDFAPIQPNENTSSRIGYAGVKIDLLKHLALTRSVQRIKLASLKLTESSHHVSASTDVLDKLQYEVVPDTSHTAVASLLGNLLLQSALLLILSTTAIYWFLHYRLGSPLRQLSLYIDRCRMGMPYAEPLKAPKGLPVAELEKVRKSLSDYQEQLTAMQGNLEKTNAQLWTQAHHDPLTAAYNRRAFEEDWEQLLATSRRREVNVSFMLFDCDHFKTINDSYGHHIGDEVIRILAEVLSSILRNGEKLYRLGGDEFACLLTETTTNESYIAAQRAEQAVAAYDFRPLGILEPVRISIGLAHFRGQDPAALDKLTRQADIAMYLAKRPGYNKIMIYAESMAEMADSVISSMETSAVYEALNNHELIEMVYQPVLQLPGKGVEYYESLVRIRYKGKLIIPGNIFPVVEARRLEAEFDLAVVSRVSLDLELGSIPKGSGVSINISGPGILNPAVIDKLHSLATWIADYKIVVEVTETALITQIGFASANLDALRTLGFYVALDDFGSGYSSLHYLSNMPVDTVKFDISLIRSLLGEARQSGIVENLAHLIKNAGYQMVAEGIETEEMLQKVAAIGFTHGQGFYLGKPQRLP